jgi:hypothetical protein
VIRLALFSAAAVAILAWLLRRALLRDDQLPPYPEPEYLDGELGW